MGCPTEVEIGDDLVFSIMTHDPDTGVLTDADSAPAYRIYEAEASATVFTGTMAKLDDGNTTGFYTELIACTAGVCNNGKTYTIYIVATVDSDQGGISYSFKAYDDRKANVTKVSDDATAANNLELDYDGTGYTKANSTIGSASSIGDKTGYSISGSKQTLDALTDGSGVTVATSNDKTGYSISGSLNTFDDMENLSAGTINAQVDTALSDIGLDNLIQVSAGGSAATEGSYLDLIMNATSGGTFIQGTDSLEAIRNNQSDAGASATTIAAAVWGALIASYDVNDTFGNVINDLTEDNGGVHRFTTAALAQGPTGAGASATTIAGAVWDAFGSSHTVAGTFGVDAISLSADTIWDEVVDGTTTARESLVISNTILAGKVSGGSSTTATFRDVADSKDRIVVVFTVDGDKTSVTFSDIAA